MRELKFRAWNGREMLYEFGFYHDSFGTFPKVNEGFKHLASLPKGELDFPFHVMQFAGLFDTSSKPIYEGDIIQDEEGDIYQICWSETDAAFRGELLDENGKFCDEFGMGDLFGLVIGNIYETDIEKLLKA